MFLITPKKYKRGTSRYKCRQTIPAIKSDPTSLYKKAQGNITSTRIKYNSMQCLMLSIKHIHGTLLL